MANIYTSKADEEIIAQICHYGWGYNPAKWTVLRVSLAKSLMMADMPKFQYDHIDVRGSEYQLKTVTGEGYSPDQNGERDFNTAICAMLSILHEQDLFTNTAEYHRLLQRHIRRGLDEIRRSWSKKDDFYDYLYQEFFSTNLNSIQTDNKFENIQELLTNLETATGLKAELVETIIGYRLTRYMLRFGQASDFNSLQKGLNKFCFQMGIGEGIISAKQAPEPLTAYLDYPLPKEQWKLVNGKNLRVWLDNTTQTSAISVWLGVDILGNPHVFDLNTAPHVLVAGATGSGKSVCVHAMLLSLLWRLSSKELQLCLIDPKRVDYSHYAGIPHLYQGNVITETTAAINILETIVEEMEYRTRVFAKFGFTKFDEMLANKQKIPTQFELDRVDDNIIFFKKQNVDNETIETIETLRNFNAHLFSYLIVFIDELSDLIMQKPCIEDLLIRLAQKGRAMGIHLILATQRPDAKTFQGNLRSNIPGRIALAVQKATESKIILDETGAEGLLKPGDMLVRSTAGADIVRVHGVEIRTEDIIECVQYINEHNAF